MGVDKIFFIKKLARLAEDRVKLYGAQYSAFAIFGMINYPVAYLFEFYASGHFLLSNLILRAVAFFLCLFLYFFSRNFYNYKNILPIYWYCTITFSIPLLTTYLLLQNHLSFGWLINFNIGVMIAILLLDWLSFILVELSGIVLGVIFFIIANKANINIPKSDDLSIFFYLFFCIVILAPIFSRNKDLFNHSILNDKNEQNKILEDKVADRTRELSLALSAKTEFLNNMSHEIRTPIQGFTNISRELVNHWSDFNEKKRFDFANHVANNAQRLSSLVGNLLDLAKFTANKMLLEIKSFDLVDLFKIIIDECTALYLDDKKIKFKLIRLKSCIIKGDSERIGQVIRNLLVNAIKFSPSKANITIEIAQFEQQTNSILISITDEGVGIPQSELKSIFSPFTQSSKTNSKAGGTGLGLSICDQIIKAHHGKIWAENNEKIGSKFNIILPQDSAELESSDSNIIETPSADILNTAKNILIIDDEEACLVSFELLLHGTKLNVIKANCGQAGLDYLRSHPKLVDVIVLDLMMPDIYGINLLKTIKADEQLARIPVILQSGISDGAEIQRAFDCGICDFIKKPYDRKTITKAIVKALTVKSITC